MINDEMNFAAAGNPLHISVAAIARQAGVEATKVKAVVFNSGTDTALQVAGGHLDVGVQSPGSAAQLVQAGKVLHLGLSEAAPETIRLDGVAPNDGAVRE